MHRPSDHELHKRIEEAKVFLRDRDGYYANQSKVSGELNKLDILHSEEVWKLIRVLLTEITPKDYAGGRPPQKSYEKTIMNRELFAFCWYSAKLGKQMYIKFALMEKRY